jgi:hypothetical protein
MRVSRFSLFTLVSYVLVYGAMASGHGAHTKYSPSSAEFWYCSLFCFSTPQFESSACMLLWILFRGYVRSAFHRSAQPRTEEQARHSLGERDGSIRFGIGVG